MANTNLLITAAGPDKIGFVEELTRALVEHGANIEESRMARLAGDFAALVLVSIPPENIKSLRDDLMRLRGSSVEVSLRKVVSSGVSEFRDYRLCALSVEGADHEGIIQGIAHVLTSLGVNIAELESDVTQAPESGAPLFNMRAKLQVPPSLGQTDLEKKLRRAAEQMAVTIALIA